MLREGYADVHHTPHASTPHVPPRNGHRGRAAVSRRDDAGTRESADASQSAGAHGIRVRAERDGHAALEPRLRGEAAGSPADAPAPRAAQGRHPAAWEP